jgi:hypothetical protein
MTSGLAVVDYEAAALEGSDSVNVHSCSAREQESFHRDSWLPQWNGTRRVVAGAGLPLAPENAELWPTDDCAVADAVAEGRGGGIANAIVRSGAGFGAREKRSARRADDSM